MIQSISPANLHPSLKKLLDAEIAAGNTVVETGGGWPKQEAVHVTLIRPLLARPSELPAGVVYTDVNDPQWWKEEYYREASGHMIICRSPPRSS